MGLVDAYNKGLLETSRKSRSLKRRRRVNGECTVTLRLLVMGKIITKLQQHYGIFVEIADYIQFYFKSKITLDIKAALTLIL